MRLFLSTILFVSSALTFAQKAISYELGLGDIQHHELRIKVTFAELNRDTLEIRMPNSSPGRYALHNFAKNVYAESATDSDGKPLELIRTTPFSWKIPLSGNDAIFEYTLYGNHADGTYAGIDAERLHLNMPATFAYGTTLQDRKIDLIIDLTDKPEWSVGTQLQQEDDHTFTAPNYYYFFDSPTMVGEMSWRSWEVDGQTIEVAAMHQGNDQELDSYVEWIKKIVDQEKAVFGELPTFDYGKYTFLCSYSPWVHGDAMEHRNSTVCTSQGNLAQHAPYLIGSISHEFFHAWNIERIRPKSLEPFDFDNANLSGELWFGEGFTNYYDELALCRSGIISQEKYLATASAVLNKVLNSPGRKIRTPIQMSHNALFVDAGTANDATNYQNNFISYYTYGELLGLVLDLSIRSEFRNLSLDDYMKHVWQQYGKTERPYYMEDLQQALATVTGDETFAKDFFTNYIYDSQLPDFEELYKQMGIEVALAKAGKIYTGKVKVAEDGRVESGLLKGTALYEAGLNQGDRLLSLNGIELDEDNTFEEIVSDLKPGKTYVATYEQLGKLKSAKFTAIQDPTVVLTFADDAGKNELKNREDWLGAK
ncbi:MAG: M61 family peptidase [Cyclobacteriaceae bacterium]